MIQISTAMVSSRQSAATKSGGFDNADSEWSHVAWAMLMPCGSRKGGIVKESQKYREIRNSSHSFRRVVEGFARKMTKQRFVIGEFISVTMNEPMLFCFVIGEFISVTMNEPMLFCFVIDEFCSNNPNVA